jgi:hypothetical protein
MSETNSMKISILAVCLLCAATAVAQAGGMSAASVSSQVSSVSFQSHEAFASQHAMGTEQNILESSTYSYAQGERPLWEVAPISHPTPLGDSARMIRKEHAAAKKADHIWNSN